MNLNTVLIANIISIIAGILGIICGFVKKKKNILGLDIFRTFLALLCSFLLGAYASLVCKPFTLFVSFKGKKDELTKKTLIITGCITLILVIITAYITKNPKQLVSFVPMVIGWSRGIIKDNDITVKELGILSLLFYIPYNIFFKNFASIVFDSSAIITSSFTIFKMKKQKR